MTLKREAANICLTINSRKTKYMDASRDRLGGVGAKEVFEVVEEYV